MSDGWFAVALFCFHPLNPQGRSQHASGAWDLKMILSHCGDCFSATSHRRATTNRHSHVTMNRCHRRRCCVIPTAMEANNYGRCATEASSYDHSAMQAGYTAAHCGLQAFASEAANNASRCHDCRCRDCCRCWTRAASRWAGAVPAEACCRPGPHGHCRGLMLNHSLLSHGQSSMGTSASHRYPACAGSRCLYLTAVRCRYGVRDPDLLTGTMASGRKLHFRRWLNALTAHQPCSIRHRHGRYGGCLASHWRKRWNCQVLRPVRQFWELRRCRSSHFRRRCRRYRADQPDRGRHACQFERCPGLLKRRFLKTRLHRRLAVPPRAAHAASGHGRTLVQPVADVW